LTDPLPRICDYEGSNYRTDFWEGRGRNYEDRVERLVLRQLLPGHGRRLLEIGAGFGRLTGEYRMFDQVVVLDYSFSQLQFARQHYGDDRYLYVAADAYKLPLQAGTCDAATLIRVIHHVADVPAVLSGIRRVLTPDARFILEFANKRNLKAMIRYALRRQTWNPNTLEPVEFVELNFDFHPEFIRRELVSAGFEVQRRVPVSFFRVGLLKRTVPTGVLAAADRAVGRSGWLVSPSVFVSCAATDQGVDQRDQAAIFACPEDGGDLRRDGDLLTCQTCGRRYAIRDGIYDFKNAVDR
jgi:SAM-dependent methyltransferase